MNETWVRVGDVCRERLGLQCQYGSRYLTGLGGTPRLGDDLRWHGGDPETCWQQTGPGGDYHALRLHADDVETFVARVTAHQRATGRSA